MSSPQNTPLVSSLREQNLTQASAGLLRSYSSPDNLISFTSQFNKSLGSGNTLLSREFRGSYGNSYLDWVSEYNNEILISGSSDQTRIINLKKAITQLKNQYFQANKDLAGKGFNGQELSRRFLSIQHQIDRLYRHRVDTIHKGSAVGNKELDLNKLLLQRQNTIVELEKENQNLRERLRLSLVSRTELQVRIEKLTREIFELRGFKGTILDDTVQRELRYGQAQQQLSLLRQKFASTIGIWQSQLQGYKAKYPEINWQLDLQVIKYIQDEKIQPIQVNGYSIVELPSTKVRKWLRDVSVNEELNLLIRKAFLQILDKYPNIKTSIDSRILKFISNASNFNIKDNDKDNSKDNGNSKVNSKDKAQTTQIGSNLDLIIDLFDQVSLNRLVEIVKYVPEPIRVENVYSFGNSKGKKVEFHLRVLIKALLDQLQKLKTKYGAVLDIDEGIIGMINQEILDIVNIDDILKIFRAKERIVEVERIVEKVVEKIVEVPKLVPVQKYVEKIVEVPKYIEVEKIIHKPVEVIKVVDKIVEKYIEVPTIEEKVIEVPTEREIIVSVEKQIPKIIQVQKIVKQIVVDTKYIQVEKIVNHYITDTKVVEVIKEIPIISEVIKEVIKPVEIIVEKIVPVEVIKIQLVEVQKIIEKIVKEIEYLPMPYNQLVVKERIVEVPVYIQKLVPVETVINKVVNVPQRVQVPVIVRELVPQIKEIEVIVEKVVQRVEIREVQRIKNIFIENTVEVIKTVQRKIEVPIIQDRIIQIPIHKIVVERVHTPHVVPVKCIQEKIVEKLTFIEVEKPYIKYIKDIQVIHCAVEKIVQVPITVEKIKEVKVVIQKIVTKLVEVPRVVEVEKAVEKIVVVPRIIEKIVEVPQRVEVIVEKIIEVPIVKTVEVVVQKIVYVDRPVQIQKINNIYHQVNHPVEVIKEVPVITQTVIEKKEIVEIPIEKIVTVQKPYAVQVFVDNVIEKVVQKTKVLVVDHQDLVIVQVPKIVDRLVEKAVETKNTVIQYKQVHVPYQVQVKQETTVNQIVEVQKIRQKAVAIIQPKIVTETQIVINEKFSIVPETTKVPFVVPAEKPYLEPIVVDRYIEKPVEVFIEIRQDKPINITKTRPIDIYKVVQLNKDKCYIETEHKIVKETIDKIIPANTYEQYAVEKEVTVDKVIPVKTIDTKVVSHVQTIEKVIEKENFTTVQDLVPYYETKVQVVDRFESTQVHEFTTQEKIVTVQEFSEKIYERIIVMPQVVEVVKYITQVTQVQNSLIAQIHVDILEQEKQYRELYGLSKKQLDILLAELIKVKDTQPSFQGLVEIVQQYLIDFDKLASIQRIVPIEKVKVVEQYVPKPVIVPAEDNSSTKNQIAYSLLIQKLIVQLKRINKDNGVKLQLDNDIIHLFFGQVNNNRYNNININIQEGLSQYAKDTIEKLNSLGSDWTQRHELMLSTIIAQRFSMAEIIKQANLETEKARAISLVNQEAIRTLESKWTIIQKLLGEQREALNQIITHNAFFKQNKDFKVLITGFDRIAKEGVFQFNTVKIIESIFASANQSNWTLAASKINELEKANKLLLQKLSKTQQLLVDSQNSQTTLEQKIAELTITIEGLDSRIGSHVCPSFQAELTKLQQYELKISEYEANFITITSSKQALELQLATAQKRIEDLEIQLNINSSSGSNTGNIPSTLIPVGGSAGGFAFSESSGGISVSGGSGGISVSGGSGGFSVSGGSGGFSGDLSITNETIQRYQSLILTFNSQIKELLQRSRFILKANYSSLDQYLNEQNYFISIYESILKITSFITSASSSSSSLNVAFSSSEVTQYTFNYYAQVSLQNEQLKGELQIARKRISELEFFLTKEGKGSKFAILNQQLKIAHETNQKYKLTIKSLKAQIQQQLQDAKKKALDKSNTTQKTDLTSIFAGLLNIVPSTAIDVSQTSSIITGEGQQISSGIVGGGVEGSGISVSGFSGSGFTGSGNIGSNIISTGSKVISGGGASFSRGGSFEYGSRQVSGGFIGRTKQLEVPYDTATGTTILNTGSGLSYGAGSIIEGDKGNRESYETRGSYGSASGYTLGGVGTSQISGLNTSGLLSSQTAQFGQNERRTTTLSNLVSGSGEQSGNLMQTLLSSGFKAQEISKLPEKQ